LTALVSERRSQICLGLDPAADVPADAVAAYCAELIERAGPACVAVKPQLACFERHGAPGWEALGEVVHAAQRDGLLVLADGKRGDVPSTAAVYAEALVDGLGADAFTVNPLLGGDALEPFVAAAESAGAGVFSLVRTSNPGGADLQDAGDPPLRELLAGLVAERAERLAGESGLSGMGAVVGATRPELMARLRELMPASIFLIPGVGAQGGKPEDLAPALVEGKPASILVAAARSIAGAADPAAAAAELRDAVWALL
jgi:orotidine-5'-phosphate decarboxylase